MTANPSSLTGIDLTSGLRLRPDSNDGFKQFILVTLLIKKSNRRKLHILRKIKCYLKLTVNMNADYFC